MRRTMIITTVVSLLLLVVAVSAASANEPWWHLTTSSRPTNLWTAKSEVQELQIGSLTELRVAGRPVACVGLEGGSPFEATGQDFCEHLTGLPLTASPTELTPKLEAAWGIAGVAISEPEASKWVITTPGHFVPAVEARAPDEELGGGSVSVQGGSSGELVITATNLGDAPVNGEAGAGGVPIEIADALPQGVSALRVEGLAGERGNRGSLAVRAAGGAMHVRRSALAVRIDRTHGPRRGQRRTAGAGRARHGDAQRRRRRERHRVTAAARRRNHAVRRRTLRNGRRRSRRRARHAGGLAPLPADHDALPQPGRALRALRPEDRSSSSPRCRAACNSSCRPGWWVTRRSCRSAARRSSPPTR